MQLAIKNRIWSSRLSGSGVVDPPRCATARRVGEWGVGVGVGVEPVEWWSDGNGQ
jgi:hypothetical protein